MFSVYVRPQKIKNSVKMMEPEFLLKVTESELYSLRTQIRMKEVFDIKVRVKTSLILSECKTSVEQN